jgi:hypothetical protein
VKAGGASAEVERLGLDGLLDHLDDLWMLRDRLHERHGRVIAQQVAELGLLLGGESLVGYHQHLVGD